VSRIITGIILVAVWAGILVAWFAYSWHQASRSRTLEDELDELVYLRQIRDTGGI
jgi:hypothetical protein